MIATDRLVSVTMAGSPAERIEPVTLEEAKTQLRVTSTSEDAHIRHLIAAARGWFEEYSGRQTVDAVFDYRCTPQGLTVELPRAPLSEVLDVSVTAPAGSETVIAANTYRVVLSGEPTGSPSSILFDPFCPPGRVERLNGPWPTGELRIRRRCGYGATAESMPALVKAMISLLVGHLYRNRAEVTAETLMALPLGADIVMRGFKYDAFVVAR